MALNFVKPFKRTKGPLLKTLTINHQFANEKNDLDHFGLAHGSLLCG